MALIRKRTKVLSDRAKDAKHEAQKLRRGRDVSSFREAGNLDLSSGCHYCEAGMHGLAAMGFARAWRDFMTIKDTAAAGGALEERGNALLKHADSVEIKLKSETLFEAARDFKTAAFEYRLASKKPDILKSDMDKHTSAAKRNAETSLTYYIKALVLFKEEGRHDFANKASITYVS